MHPHFYSIYSNIDRNHLDEKYSLDVVKSFKRIVEEIDYDAEIGRLDKPKYNEFHYVELLNYIPIEIFIENTLDLYDIYLKSFPFSNIEYFIKEYYSTLIFECEEMLNTIRNGKLIWWDSQNEYDFYTYSPTVYEYCMVVWQNKTGNDPHFYEVYLSSIIRFLTTEIYDKVKKQELDFPQKNTVKFYGSQIEFIELIKSLIENGNLKGTQKDIIRNCELFFDIEIKNPEKTISDINKRNNGSETLFLDKLKNSLMAYMCSR